MQMKAYMKRTGSYMETTRLTVTVICLLLLLVVSPLYGRRYDMAIVPNTDVNLAVNVRDVLNSAGGSVTNEVITFFQTRANINKWAKYKPYRKATNFDLDYSTDPTRADGCIWGMVPPTMKETAVYFNGIGWDIVNYNRYYPNWEYQLPRGEQSEPYRLGDFKGYNTAAAQPFNTGATNSPSEINLFNQDIVSFFFQMMQNSDFTAASFFGAYSDYRFVVDVCVETGEDLGTMIPNYRHVSNNTIGSISGWADYINVNINEQWDTSLVLNRNVHVFMGIQDIRDGSPVRGTGIIAPWGGYSYPFYRKISIKQYFNRYFYAKEAAFTGSNPTWYSTANVLTFTFSGTRTFALKCDFGRAEREMYILSANSSFSPPGGYTIKIRGRISGSYQSSQYATLASSSLSAKDYELITRSSEYEPQEIYLLFDSILKIGHAYNLTLEATADNGQTFTTMGTVELNITCL